MDRTIIGIFSCVFAMALYWIGYLAWITEIITSYGYICTTLIAIVIIVIVLALLILEKM